MIATKKKKVVLKNKIQVRCILFKFIMAICTLNYLFWECLVFLFHNIHYIVNKEPSLHILCCQTYYFLHNIILLLCKNCEFIKSCY